MAGCENKGKSGTYRTYEMELDANNDPRRLLELCGQIFIYGGENGDLYRLDGIKNAQSSLSKTLVRQWDEFELRSISVSPNQKYVIVGFGDGGCQLYHFPDYHEASSNEIHPFFKVPDAMNSNSQNLLSQSDSLLSPRPGEEMIEGPCSDTPMRQVLFLDDQYAVLSAESEVMVWDVTTEETIRTTFLKQEFFKTYDGIGCRSVALLSDSKRAFCALGLDGRVTYWDCTASNPFEWKMMKKEADLVTPIKDVGEIHSSAAEHRACRPTLGGDKYLALPGATFWQWRQISFSNNGDNIEIKTLVHGAVSESHLGSIVAATPCHDKASRDIYICYWVTIGCDGRVILWEDEGTDEPKMKVLRCLVENAGPVPTDLLYFENTLFVTLANSAVMVWNNFYETFGLEKKSLKTTARLAVSGQEPAKSACGDAPRKRKRLEKQSTEALEDGDGDENIYFSSDLTKPTTASRFVDDQAADDEDGDIRTPAANDGNAHKTDYDSIGMPDDDDDNDDMDMPGGGNRPMMTTVQKLHLPEPQAPFAPSSTPLDLSRRFLCWNHIGTIVAMQGETRNTVSINFADAGFRARPTITFTDTMGLILGALGEEGGLFASDLAEDEDEEDAELGNVVDALQISVQTKLAIKKSRAGSKATGSTIYFHRFETFASLRDKDWYITLPRGERVLGCACGEGWSAVITSRRFLRLFTSGGNQDQMLWLDGDPVTTVGRSRFLAVVYHQASPLMDGTQKLGYLLYDAIANRVLGKGSMSCISPKSTLTWIGFSDDDSLFAMDSDGMLSLLSAPEQGAHWEWMPMLDTHELRKSESDSYWPIAVSAGKLNCVPLKGGVRYPNAARKPVTSNVGLRMPFARGPMHQTNAMEELSIRAKVALQTKKVMHEAAIDRVEDEEFEEQYNKMLADLDKVTLKMFAATIEAGKLEKALDLVERLHIEKSFDIAMKLADNHRKLVDLIEGIKDRRFGGPGEENYDDECDSPDCSAEPDKHLPAPRISPESANGAKRSIDNHPGAMEQSARRRQGLTS